MEYVLDTSILIEIENNNKKVLSEMVKKLGDISSIDLYLTYFGFCEYFYSHIKKNKKNKQVTLERLKKYKLINTSKESAIIFCINQNDLKESGKEIPVFDLLSSSIAIANNMAMITADDHFRRIPRLKTIKITP